MSKASARPSETNSQSIPSPEMIQAIFIVMKEIGWLPGKEHVWGPSSCPTVTQSAKKISPPTQAQLSAVFALARELGWRMLNQKEIGLIEDLRRTTYKGRNQVYDAASAMRRLRPWIDGSTYNTEE